jgi:hypothetical protein
MVAIGNMRVILIWFSFGLGNKSGVLLLMSICLLIMARLAAAIRLIDS